MGSVISHLLHFSQKFLYCFTCAALVSCLVTTIFITLGMGIGIGYNYCFVDFKTKHRHVPAKYSKYNPTPHWKRSAPTFVTASGVTNNKDDLRTADSSSQIPTINENKTNPANNTTNIPANNTTNIKQSHNNINYNATEHTDENDIEVTQTNKPTSLGKSTDDSPNMIIPISGLDLIALLSKFRSENRNYSLQIVTT